MLYSSLFDEDDGLEGDGDCGVVYKYLFSILGE